MTDGRGRAAQLKQTLEQEIVTGQLKPGARLDEMSLVDRFGVSRTPVRQALHELSSIGLVEIRPRRGAVVAAFGLKDLVDMFEVMAELEGMCGRLAARRASEEQRAALHSIHDQSTKCVKTGNHDAYYAINVDFHETIYAAAHNKFLADQTLQLRNRLSPYRRLQLRKLNRLDDSFAEHTAILAAIDAHDADKADQLLSSHVSTQSGSFSDFLAGLPSDLIAEAD